MRTQAFPNTRTHNPLIACSLAPRILLSLPGIKHLSNNEDGDTAREQLLRRVHASYRTVVRTVPWPMVLRQNALPIGTSYPQYDGNRTAVKVSLTTLVGLASPQQRMQPQPGCRAESVTNQNPSVDGAASHCRGCFRSHATRRCEPCFRRVI